MTQTKLKLAGKINSNPCNEVYIVKYTQTMKNCTTRIPTCFLLRGNNMPCVEAEARRRMLPLKISRFFEHGQNNTSDITSLSPPVLVLASFKTKTFFVDLSFSLVILCHSLLLQELSSCIISDCIISNNTDCNQQTKLLVIYLSLFFP